MTPLKVPWIVIAYPHMPVWILEGEDLERKIDCHARRGRHHRRAGSWASKNDETGWSQREIQCSCIGAKIDLCEDGDSARLGG